MYRYICTSGGQLTRSQLQQQSLQLLTFVTYLVPNRAPHAPFPDLYTSLSLSTTTTTSTLALTRSFSLDSCSRLIGEAVCSCLHVLRTHKLTYEYVCHGAYTCVSACAVPTSLRAQHY